MKLKAATNYRLERPRSNYSSGRVWLVVGKRKRTEISSGALDDIHVYRDENLNYLVLSVNRSMGYIGLEVFSRDLELLDSRFVQEADEELIDLAVFNQIKQLAEGME